MRIYVEPGFLNYFLSLNSKSSKEVEILWNIINSYAEVTWVFNNSVSFEDFEKWEMSNKFYTKISEKASNVVELGKEFKKEINSFKDVAQILLSEKDEDWHRDVLDKVIILTPNNFEIKIRDFSNKFTFKFISDQNNSWNELENLKSNLINEITITDKYSLSFFLEKNNIKKFDNNFIYLMRKILTEKKVRLKVFIKSSDADKGNFESLKQKIIEIAKYIKLHIHDNVSICLINAELDRRFDFHDRNLFSPYYIVKTGKGFERLGNKSVNSEVECYSFLDKWGYDLIRHRKRMVENYESSISLIHTPFKSVVI